MPGGPGCAQPGTLDRGGHVQVVEPPRRGNSIRRAIAERFVLTVDLLIHSYETFAKHRPNPNSMLSRMLEDSDVPYDRGTT